MNTTMIDTKEVILALKKVKEERQLSLDKILDIMENADPSTAVSKTTLARVFREGSEDQIFKYEGTLRPIANALLDMENYETGDDNSTHLYKSILKLKKDIIIELEEKANDDKMKYLEQLNEETIKFQKSLEFLKEQIVIKDKRIDQLLDQNTKLLNQLLSCPYHKNCQGANE